MAGQRGHAPAVEAVVIIPGLVLLAVLVVALARLVLAHHELQSVASGAARAASLARSAADGRAQAERAIDSGLRSFGLSCGSMRVHIDEAALRSPPGSAGAVEVHLACSVSLHDALPAWQPEAMITARAVSPVDPHRGR